jgi:hypothetical protein
VYAKVQAHEVPDADLYGFLADVCAPNETPEEDVQGWVRELLLGLDSNSARASCLLYATKLEAMSGPAAADDDGDEGGDWERGSAPAVRRRVLVEVSGFGKGRPKYAPDRAVEFKGVSVADAAQRPGGASETYDLVSPVRGLSFEQWRDTADDVGDSGASAHPLLAGRWTPLLSLDPAQLRFFASSVNLLAVLCAGRNGASQRLVKKLLPVDTILECLGELADLGLTRQRDKEGFAGLHTAFVRVLQTLHVQAAVLEKVSAATLEDSTLVWTLGEADVADNYDDVRAQVVNKIFSASTQFDEPRSTMDAMEPDEAADIVGNQKASCPCAVFRSFFFSC